MTAQPSAASDWLAVILIGGGSSFGRDANREKAIDLAVRHFRDWDHLFAVADREVKVNVVNVTGYSDLTWGAFPSGWLHGVNNATHADEPINRPVEIVVRRTPKWKRRRLA